MFNIRTITAAILYITTAFPVVPPISMATDDDEPGYVRLTCSGSGDPNPMYTWYRQDENGKNVNNDCCINIMQNYLCSVITLLFINSICSTVDANCFSKATKLLFILSII